MSKVISKHNPGMGLSCKRGTNAERTCGRWKRLAEGWLREKSGKGEESHSGVDTASGVFWLSRFPKTAVPRAVRSFSSEKAHYFLNLEFKTVSCGEQLQVRCFFKWPHTHRGEPADWKLNCFFYITWTVLFAIFLRFSLRWKGRHRLALGDSDFPRVPLSPIKLIFTAGCLNFDGCFLSSFSFLKERRELTSFCYDWVSRWFMGDRDSSNQWFSMMCSGLLFQTECWRNRAWVSLRPQFFTNETL